MKGITEIGPGNLKLVFSPDSGLLKQMHNSRTGVMFLSLLSCTLKNLGTMVTIKDSNTNVSDKYVSG